MREAGVSQAQAVLAAMDQLPVKVLPVTRETVLAAAHFNASHKVSYADAFAVVAALELEGVLVTGDPEYQAMTDRVAIEWLAV